jgi:hypothetical protein
MIDLKPHSIPDSVLRILEDAISTDKRAREVLTLFNSNGWSYKAEFISIYVYGEK